MKTMAKGKKKKSKTANNSKPEPTTSQKGKKGKKR
jgi:hypothetical protein